MIDGVFSVGRVATCRFCRCSRHCKSVFSTWLFLLQLILQSTIRSRESLSVFSRQLRQNPRQSAKCRDGPFRVPLLQTALGKAYVGNAKVHIKNMQSRMA